MALTRNIVNTLFQYLLIPSEISKIPQFFQDNNINFTVQKIREDFQRFLDGDDTTQSVLATQSTNAKEFIEKMRPLQKYIPGMKSFLDKYEESTAEKKKADDKASAAAQETRQPQRSRKGKKTPKNPDKPTHGSQDAAADLPATETAEATAAPAATVCITVGDLTSFLGDNLENPKPSNKDLDNNGTAKKRRNEVRDKFKDLNGTDDNGIIGDDILSIIKSNDKLRTKWNEQFKEDPTKQLQTSEAAASI